MTQKTDFSAIILWLNTVDEFQNKKKQNKFKNTVAIRCDTETPEFRVRIWQSLTSGQTEFTHRQSHASDHTPICPLLHKLTASKIVLKFMCCMEIKALIIESVNQICAETNTISIAIPLLKAGDVFCIWSIHVSTSTCNIMSNIYSLNFFREGHLFVSTFLAESEHHQKKKKKLKFYNNLFLLLLFCKYLGCEGWCKKSTEAEKFYGEIVISPKYSKLLCLSVTQS